MYLQFERGMAWDVLICYSCDQRRTSAADWNKTGFGYITCFQVLKHLLGGVTWLLIFWLHPLCQFHQTALVFSCKIQMLLDMTGSLSIWVHLIQFALREVRFEQLWRDGQCFQVGFPSTDLLSWSLWWLRLWISAPCHQIFMTLIAGDLQSKACSFWNYNVSETSWASSVETKEVRAEKSRLTELVGMCTFNQTAHYLVLPSPIR